MRSIKFAFLFSLFCLALLNSCDGDNEPFDPALLNQPPAPCATPNSFNVSALINGNTVRIEWDKTSGNEWEIQYGIDGFVPGSGTTVPFNVTSSLITGLNATTNYDFYIRTKCSEDEFSEWLGPVNPGSSLEACQNPTNLIAVRSATDPTKATATWSANGDENSWQVQYGSTGFVLGSGTILATSTPTKVVSGLLSNVSYDFYVRSNCSANQNSNWVGPINIVAATTVDNSALMTANIAGVQYNNMKPYLYSFSGNDISVQNPAPAAGEYTYVQIQGATSDNVPSSHQLNLYIPNNLWSVGTYNLSEAINFETADYCQVWLITNYGANPVTTNELISGSVTITEFNTVTRRIKGTFSFSYEKFLDGVSAGVYQVTNGTFNYGLDDPYFD